MKRVLPWLLLGPLGLGLFAFLGAMVFCRAYWGYWLVRPGSDSRISEFVSVERYTCADGSGRLAPTSGLADFMDSAKYYRPSPGESPTGQMEQGLLDRGIAPRSDLPASQATVNAVLDAAGTGLPRTAHFCVVIEGTNAAGEPLILAGVRGPEKSDTYPYWEFIADDERPLRPRKRVSYAMDVAGLEGGAGLMFGALCGAALWVIIWLSWAFTGLSPGSDSQRLTASGSGTNFPLA